MNTEALIIHHSFFTKTGISDIYDDPDDSDRPRGKYYTLKKTQATAQSKVVIERVIIGKGEAEDMFTRGSAIERPTALRWFLLPNFHPTH